MDSLQNIDIRKLEVSDFDELQMFHVKHFADYPISTTSFKSYLTMPQYQSVGAFLNNSLIGYIIFLKSDYEADIVYICVHPDFRRKGVAKKLLNSKCFTWNIESISDFKIFLEVLTTNSGAISFYLSEGFEIVSTRKNYMNNQDAYVMTKNV